MLLMRGHRPECIYGSRMESIPALVGRRPRVSKGAVIARPSASSAIAWHPTTRHIGDFRLQLLVEVSACTLLASVQPKLLVTSARSYERPVTIVRVRRLIARVLSER